MSGSVEVYQRDDGRIYVVSHSRVVGGPSVVNGWCKVIAGSASDDDLGGLVVEGLDVGDRDMPEVSKEDLKRLLRPLFKLAGVKSFTAFAAGTKSVGVERDLAGSYTVIPTENRGRRGGFMYVTENQVTLPPKPGAEEIARAVRRGLSFSLVPGVGGTK